MSEGRGQFYIVRTLRILNKNDQDINELELPKTCKTDFPDPDDLLRWEI